MFWIIRLVYPVAYAWPLAFLQWCLNNGDVAWLWEQEHHQTSLHVTMRALYSVQQVERYHVIDRMSISKVEKSEDCCRVLRQRQKDKLLHEAPIAEDVCGYSAAGTGAAGLLSGFPCQVTL